MMQVMPAAVSRPDVAPVPATGGGAVMRGLLADGTVVRLRALTADDGPLVLSFYRELPVEDRYLRFFSGGTLPLPDIGRPGSGWVGASRADALVGVAEFTTTDEAGTAEVALAVAHPEQSHGVGTLLLEHLAVLARRHGLRRFGARVLAENSRMRRVLDDLGLTVHTRLQGGELIVEVDLNPDARYVEAVAAREQQADVASLRAALRPRSIVVVGASRRPDTVGNAVLRNIVGAGFTGPVYAVNPHAAVVAGVPCFASVADLPAAPDLAVLCVPAAAVPEVTEACGRRGVRALLVISSGISADPVLAARLVEIIRHHDLRMIGPNCLGIANGDPAVRLDASFAAPGTVVRGDVGLVSQSGGVTIAIQDELRRLGMPAAGACRHGGAGLLVGATSDPAFGPLVSVGVGGTLTDLIADRAHRLVPLSMADAEELLDGFHAGAALLGSVRESPRRSAVRDVVLRVGRLTQLVPEIIELDLNPVIVAAEGCVVVDARIRVGPSTAEDSQQLRALQP